MREKENGKSGKVFVCLVEERTLFLCWLLQSVADIRQVLDKILSRSLVIVVIMIAIKLVRAIKQFTDKLTKRKENEKEKVLHIRYDKR